MHPISINLPLDIWKEIIPYLSTKSLAQVDQVNKVLHGLASAEYRLNIHKIKLDTNVVHANLQLLWNNPEEKYSVDSYGKLTIYSKFNLLRNLLNHSDTQKIKDAVKLTLEEAYRLAVDKNIYIYTKNSDDSAGMNRAAMYSDNYPINEVACCLKHSNQFSSIEDKIYDLFKQKLFYGFHTTFMNDIITTHRFRCNRNNGHIHNLDFHQAVYHPVDKADRKYL